MSRYINAEHFDSRIRAAGGFAEEELTEDFKDGVLTVLEMLKTEPTADVTEVVRCRDCRYSEPWYGDKSLCSFWSDGAKTSVYNDDYCSRGERGKND